MAEWSNVPDSKSVASIRKSLIFNEFSGSFPIQSEIISKTRQLLETWGSGLTQLTRNQPDGRPSQEFESLRLRHRSENGPLVGPFSLQLLRLVKVST